MASISRKSSNKVPIIIFQMLLAGRRTHNNRAFLLVWGGFYGLDNGKSKYYGFGLWEKKHVYNSYSPATAIGKLQIRTTGPKDDLLHSQMYIFLEPISNEECPCPVIPRRTLEMKVAVTGWRRKFSFSLSQFTKYFF